MPHGAVRIAVALTALGLASSACAGEGLPPAAMAVEPAAATSTTGAPTVVTARAESPDGTVVELTANDLLTMLPIGDTGVAGTDSAQVEIRSNEDLIAPTAGDGDAASRFGRITGVSGTYPAALGTAHVWIDLFPDITSAHSYLVHTAGEISKGLGGTHEPGALADAVDGFPVDGVGEEAIGLVAHLASDGSTETLITFRAGRLVVFASVVRRDMADMRVAAQYLAEEVEDGIAATVSERERSGGDGATRPPAYRFTFERIVTWDAGSVAVASEGVVDGTSVSCRVTTDGPDGRIDLDLVAVGSHLWFREGEQEDFVAAAGTAASDVRSLLTFCPAWPLHVGDAGLGQALDDAPELSVDDGELVTIHEGTIADLATVLGTTADGVDLATLRFAVIEGTPWLAGVTLIAYGPSSQLRPLVGDVGAGHVSVTTTHSVWDIGADDLEVVAPE